MFIVDDLLFAPVKGLGFILRQICEAVDRELHDPEVIKEQLLDLQARYEDGKVGEEEFAQQQAELFARLRAIKEAQIERMSEVHDADTSEIVVEDRTQ